MSKILIVDDDPDITLLLERFLQRQGYMAETCSTGKAALEKIKDHSYDLALVDFRLPDMDGMDLLSFSKKIQPSLSIVIITGYSDVKVAINCIKAGALDYVTKPLHHEEILHLVKKGLKDTTIPTETQKAPPKRKSSLSNPKAKNAEFIIGTSAQSQHVSKMIDLVAPTNMSVVILGETGTGKEVVAKRIHAASKRANQPFVAIDCGALPKDLAGSELFGHKKGAFTGALSDKTGSFELANGGTLFLDEIGNLSYENQIKLLRVLQERIIRKVGGTKDIKVDVRVLAATNENLIDEIKNGNFREDLYHRISEFKVELAPLRHRREDIKAFIEFFLQQSAEELEKNVIGFTDDAEQKLLEYYWHGNLRELKNVIKRSVLLSELEWIGLHTLPQEIVSPNLSEETSPYQTPSMPLQQITSLKAVVERAERSAIIQALEKTGYNKTQTAKLLEVDRKTLYNKMNAYGINFEK